MAHLTQLALSIFLIVEFRFASIKMSVIAPPKSLIFDIKQESAKSVKSVNANFYMSKLTFPKISRQFFNDFN